MEPMGTLFKTGFLWTAKFQCAPELNTEGAILVWGTSRLVRLHVPRGKTVHD